MTADTSQGHRKGGVSKARPWGRRLLWLLFALIGLGMIVVLLLWLWWRQFSLEQRVERLLTEQLGTVVTLQQALDLELWPQLRVRAGGLSVAHSGIGSPEDDLIQARDIKVVMSWSDLLARNFGAADVEAGKVDIVLGLDEGGLPDFSPLTRLGDRQSNPTGSTPLPLLTVDQLSVNSVDGGWQLQLQPLQLGLKAAPPAAVELATPMGSASGSLAWAMETSKLELDAEKVHVEIPIWPQVLALDFQASINLASASANINSFRAANADAVVLAGSAKMNWDSGLVAHADTTLELIDSLAPLGGSGPSLKVSSQMKFQSDRLGLTAEGELGDSVLSVSAAVCLKPALQIGADADLARLDLAEWVIPGSNSLAGSGDNGEPIIAAIARVDRLLDGNIRAEETVVRWRSHTASANTILLECQP